MATRRHLRYSLAAVALFAAVGLIAWRPVVAQTGGSMPQYYQGKYSPIPSGIVAETQFKKNSEYRTDAPPPRYVNGNSALGAPQATQPLPQQSSRPRLTQPVVAGPEGVRPASANELELGRAPGVPPLVTPADRPATFTPINNDPVKIEPQLPAREKTPAVPGTNLPIVRGSEPASGLPTTVPMPLPSNTDSRDLLPVPGANSTVPAETPATLPGSLTPTTPSTSTPTPPATTPSLTTPPPSGLVAVPATTISNEPPGSLPTKQSPAVTVEYEMPESVSVGQAFTYSLIVRNMNTVAVSGVRVEQELPSGAAYVSSEPAGQALGEGKMGWAIGHIAGASEKRIKVTIKPAEEGELRGRATVAFSTSVETSTKVTRPRIAVAISGPDVVKVGEKVPFQIKLSNTGTGPASKIGLRAQFSGGLTHSQGPVIEADILNLPAGSSRTLTVDVLAAKPGQQQCQITAFVEGNTPENAKTTVTLVEPQLVVKQSGPTRCLVKAEPQYQIDLSNPGTATTDPIQVWTVVPEGFEFLQASDGGIFNPADKTVNWKLTGLAAGGSKGLTLKVRSTSQKETVIRTVAQATAPAPTVEAGVTPAAAAAKTLEARAETNVKSEGVPALRFDLSGAEGLVEVGKEAVYDIRVMNLGTGPCTNVQLVAELAEGTVATKNDGPTLGRTTGQQILFDPIGQLGVKGEAIYRVRVKGNTSGDLRFRVKLTCDQVKTPVIKEENTRFYKE